MVSHQVKQKQLLKQEKKTYKGDIMIDKFFMVYVDGEKSPTMKHISKESAEKEAQRLADVMNKKTFVLEVNSSTMPSEVNIRIDSFEAALDYLGRKNNIYFCDLPDKHAKAMAAMYKLITIAEAWNKADNFIPDFPNRNQYKYFPWFIYDDKIVGFVCVSTTNTSSTAYAYSGSRLCFKTDERAEQFGKQFIDLWNDFLLL